MPGDKVRRGAENTDSLATKKFKSFGFGLPVRPDGSEPSCPKAFSDIPSDKLGNIMANYSAWREYSQNLYNAEYPNKIRLKEDYEFKVYRKEVELGGAKRLKEIKSAVQSDESIRKLRLQLLDSETMCEMLSHKIENYGEVISSISREISRRSSLPDKA